MASNSQTQSRCCSPHPHVRNLKITTVKRPKLIRVAATAPSLQTSITPKDAQYSHSSTRAAALLSRIVTARETPRQMRGSSIGSIESSYSTPDDQQSPKENGDGAEQKSNGDGLSSNSGNYFSFPDFENFGDYQE